MEINILLSHVVGRSGVRIIQATPVLDDHIVTLDRLINAVTVFQHFLGHAHGAMVQGGQLGVCVKGLTTCTKLVALSAEGRRERLSYPPENASGDVKQAVQNINSDN